MKLPIEWLRTLVQTSSSDSEIADALTMAGLEVEEIIDGAFHTKVTPNRGDWLSIYGTAREAAASLNLPPPVMGRPSHDALSKRNSSVSVDIRDRALCPRYSYRVIHNVTMCASPRWMQQRLIACGMRPVNAVVDITNYVMLEMGQPLHAFDLATINSGKIIVRTSVGSERLKTIDGVDRVLPDGLLVIADPIAVAGVAGVMGGASTEVTNSTTSIILESAHFAPLAVRRAAKLLNLSTEASYRFERHVDPALVPLALARATELLVDHAGCEVGEELIDDYSYELAARKIELRIPRLNAVLGTNISGETACHALTRLSFRANLTGDVISAEVPTFRSDVSKEIDLIEEVARIVGYESLPERLPATYCVSNGDTVQGSFAQHVRQKLSGFGLDEAVTHSLSAPSIFQQDDDTVGRIRIRSALSAELSGLRTSLVPNLLTVLVHNARQRVSYIRLFEIGKVFQLGNNEAPYGERRSVAAVFHGSTDAGSSKIEKGPNVDFFYAKGIVEQLLENFNVEQIEFRTSMRAGMHAARCADVSITGQLVGFVAELDPDVLKSEMGAPNGVGRVATFELDIELLRAAARTNKVYKKLPKYPAVSRDIAVVVQKTLPYEAIRAAVQSAADPKITESISLRSVFESDKIGTGQKSVALRIQFRATDRTLVDSEVESQMGTVLSRLQTDCGATQR